MLPTYSFFTGIMHSDAANIAKYLGLNDTEKGAAFSPQVSEAWPLTETKVHFTS